MRAGSEPTSPSVSANAEIAPAARRGRNFFFCSSVPNSLSGCGTPIDWCAESSATSAPLRVPAVFARDLDAERAQLAQPRDQARRNLRVALDLLGIHLVAQEGFESLEK